MKKTFLIFGLTIAALWGQVPATLAAETAGSTSTPTSAPGAAGAPSDCPQAPTPAGGSGNSSTQPGQPAPNLADDCARLARAQRDLASIHQSKAELSANLQRGRDELSSMQQLIAANQANIQKTQADLVAVQAQLVKSQADLVQTRLRISREKRAYAAFIRTTYQHQEDMLSFLVTATSLMDLVDRATMLGTVNTYGARMLRDLRADEAQAVALQADLSAKQKALADEQAQLRIEVARDQDLEALLQRNLGAMQNSLDHADAQRADLLRQIALLEVKQLDDLIVLVEQAAWDSARYWMEHNMVMFSTATAHHGRYPLVWPVQSGVITQEFGPSPYDMEPPAFGFPHFHTGIDIGAPTGTPVTAADDGVVVAAEDSISGGRSVGYGRHVIIAHRNGSLSLYGHLDSFGVKAGDQVSAGQLIGFLGSTGNSTGPHLHFEIRVTDSSHNPAHPADPRAYLPPGNPGS